jgi:hypothetical protein
MACQRTEFVRGRNGISKNDNIAGIAEIVLRISFNAEPQQAADCLHIACESTTRRMGCSHRRNSLQPAQATAGLVAYPITTRQSTSTMPSPT